MRTTDYIRIGLKNLSRNKTRSALTILAVMIGTLSIVIMLSLVIGAKNLATQQIENIGGFTLMSISANPDMEFSGSLLSSNQGMDTGHVLNDTILEQVRNVEHVVGVVPLANVWVNYVVLKGQTKKYSPQLIGVVPETNVLNLSVSYGRELRQGDLASVVVGMRMVKSLGYASNPEDLIGQKLVFFTQGFNDAGQDPPMPPENASREYWESLNNMHSEIEVEIVGISNQGMEDGQSYLTIDFARKLMTGKNWQWVENYGLDAESNQIIRKDILKIMKYDNFQRMGYASLVAKVDNTANVNSTSVEIGKLGLGVQTAKEMLEEITKIFLIIGSIIGAIGGIALFVATLGIVNTMIMSTYERTREIGILRAFGATKATIRGLFVFEAALIGFIGGVIGIILSVGIVELADLVSANLGFIEGLDINQFISFPIWLVLGVMTLTTLIGTVAGLLPAIRASNLDPVEALRYE